MFYKRLPVALGTENAYAQTVAHDKSFGSSAELPVATHKNTPKIVNTNMSQPTILFTLHALWCAIAHAVRRKSVSGDMTYSNGTPFVFLPTGANDIIELDAMGGPQKEQPFLCCTQTHTSRNLSTL